MRVYHRTKQSTSRFLLHIFLNAQGKPGMVTYNDVDYFCLPFAGGMTVVALIDANGTQVEYGYDAWVIRSARAGSMVRRSVRKTYLDIENMFIR
ncbi:MAG: hypothetical protein ACLS7Z_02040 [Christensenellales bacterium]